MDYESICFQIIAAAGSARSYYIEALREAKKGNFEKAEELKEAAEKDLIAAKKVHFSLLQEDTNEKNTQMGILLIHAEDILMSGDTLGVIVEEFIDYIKNTSK